MGEENEFKVRQSYTTVIYIHPHLYNVAQLALVRAESAPHPSIAAHEYLTTSIFCAMTLEAFLNFVGDKLFPMEWADMERKHSPGKKAKLLATKLGGIDVDFGKRPFKSFDELFSFRNTIAHGKVERRSETYEFSVFAGPYQVYSDPMDGAWTERMTPDQVRTWLEDLRDICKRFQHALDLQGLGGRVAAASNDYRDAEPFRTLAERVAGEPSWPPSIASLKRKKEASRNSTEVAGS